MYIQLNHHKKTVALTRFEDLVYVIMIIMLVKRLILVIQFSNEYDFTILNVFSLSNTTSDELEIHEK